MGCIWSKLTGKKSAVLSQNSKEETCDINSKTLTYSNEIESNINQQYPKSEFVVSPFVLDSNENEIIHENNNNNQIPTTFDQPNESVHAIDHNVIAHYNDQPELGNENTNKSNINIDESNKFIDLSSSSNVINTTTSQIPQIPFTTNTNKKENDDDHDENVSVLTTKSTQSVSRLIEARNKRKALAETNKTNNSSINTNNNSSNNNNNDVSYDNSLNNTSRSQVISTGHHSKITQLSASNHSAQSTSNPHQHELLLLTPPPAQSGYLQKQGSIFKTYSKRYFILTNGSLNEYESKEMGLNKIKISNKKIKQIVLYDYHISRDIDKLQITLEPDSDNDDVASQKSSNSSSILNSINHHISLPKISHISHITKHNNNNNNNNSISQSINNSIADNDSTDGNNFVSKHKKIILRFVNKEELETWYEALKEHVQFAGGGARNTF